MSQVVIGDILPYTQSPATSIGQTVFGTNWTANYPSDVVVYYTPLGSAPDDATQILAYPADYSVAFIGSQQEVQVTLVTGAINIGDIVTITRMTPADRENLYSNTNFTPSMLNNDFGILTLVDQQAQLVNQLIGPRYNYSAVITDVIDTILPILGENQGWVKNSNDTAIIPYTFPASGIAPAEDTYVLLTSDDTNLPNSLALSTLSTGFMVNQLSGNTILTTYFTGTTNQTTITNGYGTGGATNIAISSNPIMPGTAGMGIPTGTTGQRVVPGTNISLRYNTTLEAIEYYNGSTWVQLSEDMQVQPGLQNQLAWYATSGESVSGLSTLDNGVLLTNSSGTPGWLANGTAGYVLTANSVSPPSWQSVGSSGAITTIDGDSGSAIPSSGIVTISGGSTGLLTSGSSATLDLTGTLAIVHGGTGVTSVTIAPTASSFAGWDANKNLSAVNNISGYTTTATAGSTTTLTVGSNYQQFFTGSLNQTVQMPVANTLAEGQSWLIFNNSTGIVTIQSSGLNTITTLPGSTQATITCILNSGTTASSWSSSSSAASGGVTSITGTANQVIASASTGAITLSTPQSIGTGSSPTFAGLTLTTPLSLANGGTNASLTASNGGIFYSTASAGAILAGTATAGQLLQSGASTTPVWSTTTYPATNAINTLLYASSANVMTALATANTAVLATNGSGVPSLTTTPAATNFVAGYSTTVTAAGSTTLTASSNYQQFFTGTTTQTVVMPVTGTLVAGFQFYIVNNSTGNVTVESSGGNTIQVMAPATSAYLTCVLTSGTTAASWNCEYYFNGGSGSGTVNLGTGGALAYYATTGTAVSGTTTGTGVLTALGVAVGTAGSFVVNGGVLGTPSSGTLSGCTGLPVSTGISGFGTGVATALGNNVTGSGGIVLATSPTLTTPALGTPSSGVLSSCTATGGVRSFQIFTTGTAATYTKPANVTSILVEVLGGGGGGGGITAGSSTIAVAAGGAGGGYCRKYIASASSTYTYTVGGGGAGGIGAGAASAGGNTTFSTLTANGGAAGAGAGGISSAAVGITIGGTGGSSSGGDFNAVGGGGGSGFNILQATQAGTGGSSHYGGQTISQTSTTGNGIAGNNYGGGGGGALGGLAGGTTQNGGAGAGGLIIVWEFS